MKIINVKDACEMLDIAEPTLRRMMSKGQIPYAKIGGSVKFDVAILEAWVRDQFNHTKEKKEKFVDTSTAAIIEQYKKK